MQNKKKTLKNNNIKQNVEQNKMVLLQKREKDEIWCYQKLFR